MKDKKGTKRILTSFVWVLLLLISGKDPYDTKSEDWPTYGGNSAGNRYSPLTQINIRNVKDLKVAWMYNDCS
jgi:quinoprotein glucose dehydrogenase